MVENHLYFQFTPITPQAGPFSNASQAKLLASYTGWSLKSYYIPLILIIKEISARTANLWFCLDKFIAIETFCCKWLTKQLIIKCFTDYLKFMHPKNMISRREHRIFISCSTGSRCIFIFLLNLKRHQFKKWSISKAFTIKTFN